MVSKKIEDEILGEIGKIEIEKLKLQVKIADLTRSQGLVLNDYVSKSGLPKVGEQVKVDLGTKLHSGTYEIRDHTFVVTHKPEMKNGEYTGNFDVIVRLQALGVKLLSRGQIGEATRVAAEKTFKFKIYRKSIFEQDQDPDKILRYK